jgi:hypothetical protein
MANLLFLSALLLSLSSGSFLSGEEQLLGSWEGTEFQFEQLQGPALDIAMIEGGRALHEGGRLILSPDKTYEIKDSSGETNGQGEWKLEDEQILVIGDTSYEIVELSDRRLVTKHLVSIEDIGAQATITLAYRKQ